jgi:hypothetical protein
MGRVVVSAAASGTTHSVLRAMLLCSDQTLEMRSGFSLAFYLSQENLTTTNSEKHTKQSISSSFDQKKANMPLRERLRCARWWRP